MRMFCFERNEMRTVQARAGVDAYRSRDILSKSTPTQVPTTDLSSRETNHTRWPNVYTTSFLHKTFICPHLQVLNKNTNLINKNEHIPAEKNRRNPAHVLTN